VILLTGHGAGSNHYHAIIHQPGTERWLNLNADQTSFSGVQNVNIFANSLEEFASKLNDYQAAIIPDRS
jgi:hypothetical protein